MPATAEAKPIDTSELAWSRATSLRRILCPVDFSSASRPAIEMAVALARRSGADITALFVCPIPGPARDGSDLPETAEVETGVWRAVAEDLRDVLRPAWMAGLGVHYEVRAGDAVAAILGEARSMRADVVVMGTHGRSGPELWALGSTTAQVLRRSPCPVVTVSPSTEPLPRDGVRRILCGVDLTPHSARTLDRALWLARESDGIATVTVVHALERAMSAPAPATLADVARKRLHEAVAAQDTSGVIVEEIVAPGGARRRILRAALDHGADLIVLGLHSGPTDRIFLGSTAEQVIGKARVPVLVVPPVLESC